jgi:FAD/FMN-containing dehydrogenase
VESGDEPWRRLRSDAGRPDGGVLRLGIPASRVAEMIEAAEEVGCRAWGHLASGAVLATAEAATSEAVEALRTRAREAGGFLPIEAADTSLRASVDPFGAGETDLVQALKAQFDPRGTINPGRWMEGV